MEESPTRATSSSSTIRIDFAIARPPDDLLGQKKRPPLEPVQGWPQCHVGVYTTPAARGYPPFFPHAVLFSRRGRLIEEWVALELFLTSEGRANFRPLSGHDLQIARSGNLPSPPVIDRDGGGQEPSEQ